MEIRRLQPNALVARKSESRRQKARGSVTFLYRDRRIGQRHERNVFYAKLAVLELYLIVCLDGRLVGRERPLRNCLVTCGELPLRDDDRVRSGPLDLFRCEIDDCAVVGLVGKAGRIFKTAEACFQKENAACTGYPLIVALIKNNAALGDHLVFGLDQNDLVRLKPVFAVTHIDIARIGQDTRACRPFDGLLFGIYDHLAFRYGCVVFLTSGFRGFYAVVG